MDFAPSSQNISKDISAHPLKPGYYYSKESTNELWKVDEEFKIWIVPIILLDYPVLLDYPEVKSIATGSLTYGDYGLARKEIQDALNDATLSTVGIFLFLENIHKGAVTNIQCQDHIFHRYVKDDFELLQSKLRIDILSF